MVVSVKKMVGEAYFSECGRYRYLLTRIWSYAPKMTWIMLNPSIANAGEDDATIRRCLGFAKRWGFGAIDVINLFALIATDPKELKDANDPVGPDNKLILRGPLALPVVVGWGANINRCPRGEYMTKIIEARARKEPDEWYCLGLTKEGEPRHPLRISYDTPLERWI